MAISPSPSFKKRGADLPSIAKGDIGGFGMDFIVLQAQDGNPYSARRVGI
jgi:hypothetical protein